MTHHFQHKSIDLGYNDLIAETLTTGRTYKTPSGSKYPSVTTVLSILSKEGIDAWKKRVGAEEAAKVGFQASNRGTDVHDCLEKYVKNDPDYAKGYMPHITSAVNKIKPVLAEKLGVVYGQELALYSDYLTTLFKNPLMLLCGRNVQVNPSHSWLLLLRVTILPHHRCL